MQVGSGDLKSLELSDGGRVIARTNGEAISNQEITSAGWYTVKVKYSWNDGFVYETSITFDASAVVAAQ